jgi:hypothetical protein
VEEFDWSTKLLFINFWELELIVEAGLTFIGLSKSKRDPER